MERQMSWFQRETFDDDALERGNDAYNDFVDKFKIRKTTDDCYTPQPIYDVIADWVANEYHADKAAFFRPFYPGGDFESEDYTGRIVVDNPPFSLISKIKRFYGERGIKFFLFAPALTLCSGYLNGVTCIATDADITYENGATVRTSFVTNMDDSDIILRTAPGLTKLVDAENKRLQRKNKKELPKYEYPDNIVTAAIAMRWSKYGIEYALSRRDCVRISGLDAQRPEGKSIFGGGVLAQRACGG